LTQAVVVLDTDFLSAFLKIDRLSLVRDFYAAETFLVPPAVYREVSCTQLVEALAGLPWIRIEAPEMGSAPPAAEDPRLGPGEREAIALAGQRENALLLTNDNRAREAARRAGLKAVDIPAFLLSCKQSGFLNREQIQSLIQALWEKDRYRFRQEVLDLLLA
jgi:predicted nucleic acid-binding protein